VDLLTGATGFLGRHLCQRLAADGRQIRALVRPGTDLRRIPSEVGEVVWGDLDDAAALERAVRGIDRVFHTAARVSGRGGRAAFEAANVRGTEALLAASAKAGVRRFVHVGSAGIYGADAARGAITESTEIDPQIELRGDYAWSKAESDRRVRAFAERGGLAVVIVRPGLLYGRGLPPFIARLHFPIPRGRGRRLIVGSPTALLPFTHVENACDALVLAAERGRPGAVYNVVDGDTPQGEYLALLAQEGVFPVRPTYVPAALVAPVAWGCEVVSRLSGRRLPLSRYRLRRATESLRYDTRAARDELGWSPRVDLRTGVGGLRANGSDGV
jgi:nucleoside-diphosphate-sugar epimerase